MKRIGFLAVTVLTFSVSSAHAGLLDSLFSNVNHEVAAAEVVGGEVDYDHANCKGHKSILSGFGRHCGPCYGWHPRPCSSHTQKCGARASKCTQKAGCQKSAAKCAQKSAPKCTQKSAPQKCTQKSAPKCTQKSAAKCTQKSKCAPKHGLHIKLPTCHASKCKTPATHVKTASKCHRGSWKLFANLHHSSGKGKGKSDGKGFTVAPLDNVEGNVEGVDEDGEVDLGEPPAPSVELRDEPVDTRSASLRLFPGNAQLLPIRLGG